MPSWASKPNYNSTPEPFLQTTLGVLRKHWQPMLAVATFFIEKPIVCAAPLFSAAEVLLKPIPLAIAPVHLDQASGPPGSVRRGRRD